MTTIITPDTGREGINRELPALECWPSLDALPRPLRQAFDAKSFFQSLKWYENLVYSSGESGRRLRFITSTDSSSPIFILPLSEGRSYLHLPFPKTIKSLTNLYTIHYSPWESPSGKGADNLASRFAYATARHLHTQSGPYAEIAFDCWTEGTAFFHYLGEALSTEGYLVHTFEHFGNWYETLEGQSFEAFWASRSKQIQRLTERARRRIHSAGKPTFHLFANPQSQGEAIALYQSLYARSWKGPEPYPRFLPGLIRAAATRANGRVGVLFLDGQAIAAQVWLLSNGHATIYKLAHDEAYRQLSPGTYLTFLILKHLMEQGNLREIDFGRGDEPFKSLWLHQRRQMKGLIAYNPAVPFALAKAAAQSARPALKKSIRQGLKRSFPH